MELEQRVDDIQLHHNEIVVRMILSPINPSDLIPIRGAYQHRTQLPAIPGYEGVGIVQAVGSSVTTSLIGKRVLPLRGEGTWQQYVKTKASFAIRVPDGIDDETASQMYINPMTAWLICTEELRLKSNDVLIVNACGSAIGRIFAQFSKVFGYRLIAVVRNDIHTQELQSLGAWAVIDTSKELLADKVMEFTCGMGAAAGIDSIGGQDGHELIECIRPGGTVLSIGLMSGTQMNWAQIHQKHPNIGVKPYWLKRWIEGITDVRWHETFGNVFQLVHDGKLTIQAPRTRFSLLEYEKAIKAAQQSGHIGKVIFEPFLSN
nr:zinc-dependent alcohol dehydrogenase family protein [Paenibacillus thalictri]